MGKYDTIKNVTETRNAYYLDVSISLSKHKFSYISKQWFWIFTPEGFLINLVYLWYFSGQREVHITAVHVPLLSAISR